VQCGAVWCSVVQCGAVLCSVVQCGAVWCSVVQCGAVWCSALKFLGQVQQTMSCSKIADSSSERVCAIQQRTATHCHALQCTATHCNALQHTATHCNADSSSERVCSTQQHTGNTLIYKHLDRHDRVEQAQDPAQQSRRF